MSSDGTDARVWQFVSYQALRDRCLDLGWVKWSGFSRRTHWQLCQVLSLYARREDARPEGGRNRLLLHHIGPEAHCESICLTKRHSGSIALPRTIRPLRSFCLNIPEGFFEQAAHAVLHQIHLPHIHVQRLGHARRRQLLHH
jgi:hypothetical protein